MIYLIGPSGVGKTHCARCAAAVLQLEHQVLDDLCHGRTNDWRHCEQVMKEIEGESEVSGRFTILDIGAGTQFDCTRQLEAYLSPRSQRVILICAPSAEVLGRNPCGPNRPLEEYEQMEYRTRKTLYAVAEHVFDVSGRSKEEASAMFTTCPRARSVELGVRPRDDV